jgi:hypothetical protein
MCGLCGAFGAADHWADGLASGAASPSAERRRRAAAANRILDCYGLRLTEWANRFTLVSRTGKSAVVDNFGGLWIEAEKISGRACDPLDPAIIAKMEASHHGR